jgi:hypothetical protein
MGQRRVMNAIDVEPILEGAGAEQCDADLNCRFENSFRGAFEKRCFAPGNHHACEQPAHVDRCENRFKIKYIYIDSQNHHRFFEKRDFWDFVFSPT